MDVITEHVLELFDAGPDAMVIVDARGSITFVNRKTQTLFGYHREQLIGQPVEVLMPERFRSVHPMLGKSYQGQPRVLPMDAHLDLHARRRDGTEFPVEISSSLLETRDGLLISSTIRDVTDRRKVHDRLAAARIEADRANRSKSSFLTAASHNLRQPLQTLTLLNEVLEKTVSEPVAVNAIGAQRDALTSVRALLNALLDISKLESGAIKPDITDCSVQAIFKSLKATFEAQAQAKGLSLIVDDAEHTIRTDQGIFEQIIQNLVANAIRYTRKGMVQMRSFHDVAFVRVEVLDTGIGIAANQQGAIFDEFHQLNCEKGEGLGLGLAIVRRMVQLLGLSIEVHSEPGRGSCFAVTVPRGREVFAPALRKPGASAGVPVGDAMVLIIDDDRAVARSTGMLLKLEGYRVTLASSMQEAIAVCAPAEAWPNVIVSDFHLSDGSSGIDTIGSLRTLSRRMIPAMLVTGDTSSDVSKALEELGDCEVLSKPFVPKKFLELVNILLSENSSAH
jgi:two-component system, sensor histidine kinase